MTTVPLTVHIMTAAMTPGDAIGNYILSSARIWREWGVRVEIFADYVAPVYGGLVKPTILYPATGDALLWYHYSIYADNIETAINSPDYKIMDFHGISPAYLFAGQNKNMQTLCQQGIDLLPDLHNVFDACVVHSEYTREVLIENGFDETIIHKLPLIVDTSRFEQAVDEDLGMLLGKLEYLLFVGRIVPQKDILAMLDIFEQVHQQRPQTCLVLVGSQDHTPAYQKQIQRAIKRKRLEGRVMFTGQVNDTIVLATLLQKAAFLIVTSDWETFCVPVAEAMFFGTPPIVHNIPPLPEIAGTGGVVIDKKNVGETAVAILNILSDEIQYKSLSQAAKLRSANFTDTALMAALQNMLMTVFGKQIS